MACLAAASNAAGGLMGIAAELKSLTRADARKSGELESHRALQAALRTGYLRLSRAEEISQRALRFLKLLQAGDGGGLSASLHWRQMLVTLVMPCALGAIWAPEPGAGLH